MKRKTRKEHYKKIKTDKKPRRSIKRSKLRKEIEIDQINQSPVVIGIELDPVNEGSDKKIDILSDKKSEQISDQGMFDNKYIDKSEDEEVKQEETKVSKHSRKSSMGSMKSIKQMKTEKMNPKSSKPTTPNIQKSKTSKQKLSTYKANQPDPEEDSEGLSS